MGQQLVAAEQRAGGLFDVDGVAGRVAGRGDEADAAVAQGDEVTVLELAVGLEAGAAQEARPALAGLGDASARGRGTGPASQDVLQAIAGDAGFEEEAEDEITLEADDAVAQQEAVDFGRRAQHLRARLLPAPGQAAVVDVGVGDEDGADVCGVEAGGVELGDQGVPGAVVVGAGVDEEDPRR